MITDHFKIKTLTLPLILSFNWLISLYIVARNIYVFYLGFPHQLY